nr:RHS repeat-associated core domain-containing protein [Shewanella algae]
MVEKTLKRDGFRAQTRFYHWDEEDRLIRVSLPNGDIWHYEYDVFGRRCRKYRQQPTSAQSLTQQISQGDIRYQWLGDQLSQQQSYYADGSVATTQWLYEPGSFRPLAQIRQLDTPNDPGRPELHYAVTDLAGNVRELCDPQGQIHWRGEQGLWQDFHQWRLSGTPKKYLEQAANEPLHCDLRYQGQIYDRETGLYYNRHRYYDPEICQYLSPDPIGLAGGTRPQAYVHNPLEWVDPLGLERFPSWMSTKQGYERHHIISYEHRAHPFFNRSDLNINGATNMVYLPVADGIHPTKMTHHHFQLDGKPHAEYNAYIKERLDRLEESARVEGWDKERVNKELLDFQHETRYALNNKCPKG